MATCSDGDVRLIGGITTYEGRLEVCLNRAWGSVCAGRIYSWSWWWWNNHYWDTSDSNVVCRQLGHMGLGKLFAQIPHSTNTYIGSVAHVSHYGHGVGPIFMSNVHCSGTESKITDCSYTPAAVTSICSHSKDVGVKCEGSI